MKTVKVICALPSDNGIIFRATPPTLAHDSAHYVAPHDLELTRGVNANVSLEAVNYWKRRTAGLSWLRNGDTVVLTVDECDAGVSEREQIAKERRALTLERMEHEREKIARERAAIDAARRSRKRR
jgi:hypothetical protein